VRDSKNEFSSVPSTEELVKLYTADAESNPASIYYKRKIVRPNVRLGWAILCVLITVVVSLGLSFLAYLLTNAVWVAIVTGIAVILITLVVFAKRIFIWLIKAYQKFAPAKLRERCRYEPSCSNYMIASIEKYGLLKGAKKGFKRWGNCKPPNGGFDEP
jgi:putative membrane protein insertion efficiency factor